MLVVSAKMAVAATSCLCPRRQHIVCDLGAQPGGGIEAAVASTYTHISFAVSGNAGLWLDEHRMSSAEMFAFAVGSSLSRR